MGSLKEHNDLIDKIIDEFLPEQSSLFIIIKEYEYDVLGDHGESDILAIDYLNNCVYNYEIKCSLVHEDKAKYQLHRAYTYTDIKLKPKEVKNYLVYYTDIEKKQFGIKQYFFKDYYK